MSPGIKMEALAYLIKCFYLDTHIIKQYMCFRKPYITPETQAALLSYNVRQELGGVRKPPIV